MVGVCFRAPGEASFSKNRAHRPGGGGESSPGGGRSILQGLWGGIIFQKPGTPARRGWGVQPGGWLEYPSGPLGRHHFPRNGHTAWGGRGVQRRGWSEYPSGPLGGHHLPRTGHTGPGGTGSLARGVVGLSFKAPGEASSSKNRAHRPGGDRESSPGGGRSILQGLWGGIIFQEPGTPALGGRGVQPRGWFEYPSGPLGGGIIFQEWGTPAWGGRGVQPRRWSEYPSGPLGRHHLPRTGHTGLGGTGSPAQGVVGVPFGAHGEASSSKNQAHWPGGDGESSPGGGRSIRQGRCGGIIFQEPGTPAWGGR